MSGPIQRITNLLNGISTARLAAAALKVPYVLGASNIAATLTGSTNETALGTIRIPAGSMGLNGIIRVTTIWEFTNSANSKVLRYRLGGTSGTVWMQHTATTTSGLKDQRQFGNRNSASIQIAGPATTNNSFTASSSAPVSMTINTATDQDLVISAQLALDTETIILQSYLIELIIP